MLGKRFFNGFNEKIAPSVIDKRPDCTWRVNQSMTAARDTKPRAVGMSVISIAPTSFKRVALTSFKTATLHSVSPPIVFTQCSVYARIRSACSGGFFHHRGQAIMNGRITIQYQNRIPMEQVVHETVEFVFVGNEVAVKIAGTTIH